MPEESLAFSGNPEQHGIVTNDTIGTVLGIYAAGLSTVLGAQQIWNRRRRVRLLIEFLVDGSQPGFYHQRWAVHLVNLRSTPVEIVDVGFITDEYRRLEMEAVPWADGEPTDELPLVLNEGKSATLLFPAFDGDTRAFPDRFDLGNVANTEIRGVWARDMLGRDYTARLRLRWEVPHGARERRGIPGFRRWKLDPQRGEQPTDGVG